MIFFIAYLIIIGLHHRQPSDTSATKSAVAFVNDTDSYMGAVCLRQGKLPRPALCAMDVVR